MTDTSAGDDQIKQIPVRPPAEAVALDAPLSDQDPGSKEAILLSRGLSAKEIEAEAATNDHRRTQKFRDNFEIMAIIALWSAFAALLSMAAVWLWHTAMPACWHWLDDGQIGAIQNIVTGGIIAAALGDHFKRRLG